LIAAGTALAADGALPECIPPGTNVVFGASLRTLLNSALVKSFSTDVQKWSSDLMKGGQLPVLEVIKSAPASGFDPLKDVDDLIVATTVEGDKSTALIVLHGRFDPTRWPGTSKSYNGVPVFADEKKANGAVALLDDSTAIMGDLDQVHAAIDRRSQPSQVNPALAEHVRMLAGRFDFWGVGDLPKGYHPPGGADDLSSIDHFEFGAALRQGLEITGEIHARTPKDAEKMAESMKMIEAMVKAQPSTSGTKIGLQSANATIKLSIAVSEEDLKKGIEAQRSGVSAALNSRLQVTGGTAAVSTSSPVKSVPPPKGEIVKNDHGETLKVTLPGGR
jgi:hypothetical protein